LGIDTIFPLLLIIAGLWLATVAVIEAQPPKLLTPYLYPAQTIFSNSISSATSSSSVI
jgi:hypothetical protein